MADKSIVLTLNRGYMLRWLGVGVFFVGIAALSIFDGMVKYPRQNVQFAELGEELSDPGVTPADWLVKDDENVSRIDKLYQERFAQKAPSHLVSKLNDFKKNVEAAKKNARDVAASSFAVERHKEFCKHIVNMPLWSEQDILSQFIMAGILGVFALLLWVSVGCRALKKLSLTNGKLMGFTPEPIAREDVAAIDAARWEDKGIVRLTTKSGATVVLDAWYYAGVREIVKDWLGVEKA